MNLETKTQQIETKTMDYKYETPSSSINLIRALEMKNVCANSDQRNAKGLVHYIRTGQTIETKGLGYDVIDGNVQLHHDVIFHDIQAFFPLCGLVTVRNKKGKSVDLMIKNPKVNTCKWRDPSKYSPKYDTPTFESELIAKEVKLYPLESVADISIDLLEDMGDSEVFSFVQNQMQKDFGRTITQTILFGKNNSFDIPDSDHTQPDSDPAQGGSAFADDKVQIEGIIPQTAHMHIENGLSGLFQMIGELPSVNQAKASWVMSNATLAKLLGSDLNNNNAVLTNFNHTNQTNCASYMLLGKPVYIVDEMQSSSILLGDFKSGYTLFCNPNAHLNREAVRYVDAIRIWIRDRIGGFVADPKAFVVGKINDNTPTA